MLNNKYLEAHVKQKHIEKQKKEAMQKEEFLEGEVRPDQVEKHRENIMKELNETLCSECPLQIPCRLLLAIHIKDICSILRDNQETEDKPNGRD